MRKYIQSAAIGILAIAASVTAKPFAASSVAPDAKWVMHLDVDAIAGTNTWKLIQPRLMELPQFAKARADIERVGQVKLPNDLHDVTLYGPSFGEQEAVIVISASVNEERLKTLVSLNESYATEVVGGQHIHSWTDKDKQIFGGFSADHRIVIGRSVDTVVKALDVLNGKVESLQKGVLIPETENAGLLMYVAGDEIAKLAKAGARSPIVQQLQQAWITVVENENGMLINSQITANDQKVAMNVKNAIEGVKAMVSFAGQDDPDANLMSEVLLELNTNISGNAVNVNWKIPGKTINDVVERATGRIEKPAKITAP